jgi:hypothetical protein
MTPQSVSDEAGEILNFFGCVTWHKCPEEITSAGFVLICYHKSQRDHPLEPNCSDPSCPQIGMPFVVVRRSEKFRMRLKYLSLRLCLKSQPWDALLLRRAAWRD